GSRSPRGETPGPARSPGPPGRHPRAPGRGPATFAMPDWTIGYSIPRRSQSGVRSTSRMSIPLSGADGQGRRRRAVERAGKTSEQDQRQPHGEDDRAGSEVGDEDEPVRKVPARLPAVDAA